MRYTLFHPNNCYHTDWTEDILPYFWSSNYDLSIRNNIKKTQYLLEIIIQHKNRYGPEPWKPKIIIIEE